MNPARPCSATVSIRARHRYPLDRDLGKVPRSSFIPSVTGVRHGRAKHHSKFGRAHPGTAGDPARWAEAKTADRRGRRLCSGSSPGVRCPVGRGAAQHRLHRHAYVNGHVTFVAPGIAGQISDVLVDDNETMQRCGEFTARRRSSLGRSPAGTPDTFFEMSLRECRQGRRRAHRETAARSICSSASAVS